MDLIATLSPQTRATITQALHALVDDLFGQALTTASVNGTAQPANAGSADVTEAPSSTRDALTAEDQLAIREEIVRLVTTAAAANGDVSCQVKRVLNVYAAQRVADLKPKDLAQALIAFQEVLAA